MSKVLYRYEIDYKSWDDDTNIQLVELQVVRETAHCYFVKIFPWGNVERRVSKDAGNTYAYDTKEEAKKHFIRRTHKRISWYEYWMEECKKGLELIKAEETN